MANECHKLTVNGPKRERETLKWNCDCQLDAVCFPLFLTLSSDLFHQVPLSPSILLSLEKVVTFDNLIKSVTLRSLGAWHISIIK